MKLPPGSWPAMLTPFNADHQIDWRGNASLVEFYVSHGAAGLFAACWSSETMHLHDDEKVRLAFETVRVAGDTPVVAGAIAAGTRHQQADLVRRIADTGVRAVVISASQIAPAAVNDDEWRRKMDSFLKLTDLVPLGIYECPSPYHRLLPPDTLRSLAETGRFIFHKDTSCDADVIRRKLDAIRGTGMNFFNANTPTLLFSLHHGAAGYCGVGANFFPELYTLLCRDHAHDPSTAKRLLQFMINAQPMIDFFYPVSAKYVLSLRGVPIGTTCRLTDAVLTTDQMLRLRRLKNEAERLLESCAGGVTCHVST